MKNRLRHSISAILIAFLVLAIQQDTRTDIQSAVRGVQSSLRKSMEGLKYDGSKVTYFETINRVQFKEVEVILFLRENNHLFFSGELSPGRVSLRIYDGPASDQNRLVLFEARNIANKTVKVAEQELIERLRFYDPNPKRLRSVYVDYEIARSRREERGAIIMAVGYEDKK
jgi:hypothetical protein